MDSAPQPARLIRAGDSAIVLELDERIDPVINSQCRAIANEVRKSNVAGIRDVVPAYRSVTVYFDPLRTDHALLIDVVKRSSRLLSTQVDLPRQTHRIPICYDLEFGPDLPEVAAWARLSIAETIDRHLAADYRVFMLGFIPGFAYLGTVDERIAAPRRETPRTRVAAGSVAIAAAQTAIYPVDCPGGWQLIGRTPLRVFDSSRPDPSLFMPGDLVRFFAISRQEWDRYAS